MGVGMGSADIEPIPPVLKEKVMAEIIERMGNVEDMPEWMQEAFGTGRVYHTCVTKVAELEKEVERLREDKVSLSDDRIHILEASTEYKRQAIEYSNRIDELEGKLLQEGQALHEKNMRVLELVREVERLTEDYAKMMKLLDNEYKKVAELEYKIYGTI